MREDESLLASCPDVISIGSMLKATPAMEGDRRFLYFEASNEGRDIQNEVVAAKALGESAPYFLTYGNIDIDHLTMIGPKLGIPDAASYEIGLPVDVGQSGKSTFVKAEIYSGDGPAAVKANQVWSSLTDLRPAARWYPSVAGAVLDKAIEVDPETKGRKVLIKSVRWSNVGLSKTPVNPHVPVCATVPVGVFAKCLVAGGIDFSKALEAGYGTDSASLTGGAALRKQSLQGAPFNYFDYRNKLADALRKGECGESPGAHELIAYTAKHFGVSGDEAAEHVEHFMRDLHRGLSARRNK